MKLPRIIKDYINASNAHDVRSILACFSDDAVVRDEGQTLHGKDSIEGWIAKTIEKYKFQLKPLSIKQDDAEVVVTLASLFHCVGMSIHRHGHEDFSLFLSEPKMQELLEPIYDEPNRTVIVSEVLQAIISHRADGQPSTIEAGIIRVADALDMAKGRSRIPFERGRVSMHSLSAAAIEDVEIKDGDERPILVEIHMNNSSGIFQIDGLLKAKLRGSGLEPYIEVAATIEGESEKRLLESFRF